jgi:hypothetical protein
MLRSDFAGSGEGRGDMTIQVLPDALVNQIKAGPVRRLRRAANQCSVATSPDLERGAGI